VTIRHVRMPGPALTDEAGDMDALWNVFVAIASFVVLLVAVLLVWCIVRYRRRDEQLPRQVRHHLPTEIVYTLTPLLIVVGLFAGTYVSVRAIERADEPDLVVDVTGFQWQWRFAYPDDGVVVTGTERAAPVLVLPSDSTVRFRLTSTDVIHSFWIPGFRYKRDMFPGAVQEFDVRIGSRTGTWADGVCAEFCGLDHTSMRFTVRVVEPPAFQTWIDEQRHELAAAEQAAA
jgi:cytochrome c oxidase subunit 2